MNNWSFSWRKLVEWDEEVKIYSYKGYAILPLSVICQFIYKMNTIGMKLNALTGLLSWKVKMNKIKKNLILMKFGIC